MKAINDFKIKVSDVLIYETGVEIKKYQPVYFTGIEPGSYTAGSISETVVDPFETGYYYALGDIPSGSNYFFRRPDHPTLGKNDWTQDWFYLPTYGSSVSFNSNLYSLKFGDGYVYNSSKNENSLRIEAQLNFDGITDLEAKSIIHFYQNNALQDLGQGEGLKPIDVFLFQPFSRKIPCYINNINYEYVYDDVNNLKVNIESPFLTLTDWKGKMIPHTVAQDYDVYKSYTQHDYVYVKEGSITERGAWFLSGFRNKEAIPYSQPRPLSPKWTKKFYFKPDISNSVEFKAENYKNELDKFFLMQQDSENPNLQVLELKFTKRSDKEAKAMLYFLEDKNGIDNFEFASVPNFTGYKNFFCPRWSHTYNYKDNNSIDATFVETAHGLPDSAEFYTIVDPPLEQIGSVDFGYVPSGFAVTKKVYLMNSGDSDVKYTTQPVKIRDEKSQAYIGMYISDNSDIKDKVFSPFESGYIDYTYYLTDLGAVSGPSDYPVITGPFNYSAQNEFIQYSTETAEQGPNVKVLMTGRSDIFSSSNFSTGPNSSWLGYNKYFIAYPDYDFDNDNLKLQVRWKPPSTGYFYDSFSAQISESPSFTPNTGNTINVQRSKNPLFEGNIYGEIDGLEKTYSSSFGDLEIETTYYVRVKGQNSVYFSDSVYSHATGIWGEDFNITNPEIINGVTGDLPSISIPIFYSKVYDTIYLTDPKYYNIDVYNEIKEKGIFKTKFEYYSGVNIVIGPNSIVGSRGNDAEYTGSIIITGDYSPMVSGLTITLNGSQVYGLGGNRGEDGNTAIFIKASGDIFLSVDDNTVIGGGGGGGSDIQKDEIIDFLQTEYHNYDQHQEFVQSLNNFYENDRVIYGGYGAGSYEYIPDLRQSRKVFVDKPSYNVGSEGYTVYMNPYLQKGLYEKNS
jgi:hypothetical protein